MVNSPYSITLKSLQRRYHEITEQEGFALWNTILERAETTCIHGSQCTFSHCEIGKATQIVHLVTGLMIPLWECFQAYISGEKKVQWVRAAIQVEEDNEDNEDNEDKENNAYKSSQSMTDGEKTRSITGVRLSSAISDEMKKKLKDLEAQKRHESTKE